MVELLMRMMAWTCVSEPLLCNKQWFKTTALRVLLQVNGSPGRSYQGGQAWLILTGLTHPSVVPGAWLD